MPDTSSIFNDAIDAPLVTATIFPYSAVPEANSTLTHIIGTSLVVAGFLSPFLTPVNGCYIGATLAVATKRSCGFPGTARAGPRAAGGGEMMAGYDSLGGAVET